MASEKFAVINRLRGAVQKVRFLFLLSLKGSTRWVTTSVVGASPVRPQISFKRQPSLLDAMDDEDYYDAMSRICSPVSTSNGELSPAIDVDERAEIFIRSFRKHLLMEKQVSLKLRYCKEFPKTSPDGPGDLDETVNNIE